MHETYIANIAMQYHPCVPSEPLTSALPKTSSSASSLLFARLSRAAAAASNSPPNIQPVVACCLTHDFGVRTQLVGGIKEAGNGCWK